MSANHDAEMDDLMARWRKHVATHRVPTNFPEPADPAVRFEEALALADQRWRPPHGRLPDGLQVFVDAWQSEWTTQLRTSAEWQRSRGRLAGVREFLDGGNLLDAGLELESILVDCCPSARQASAS